MVQAGKVTVLGRENLPLFEREIFRGCSEVAEHQPEGEHDRNIEEEHREVNHGRFTVPEYVPDEAGYRHHLEGGLPFPDSAYRDLGPLPELRHPLAEGGYGDLAADDGYCGNGDEPGIAFENVLGAEALDDEDQRSYHGELVRHRIDERAEL